MCCMCLIALDLEFGKPFGYADKTNEVKMTRRIENYFTIKDIHE